MLNNTVATKHPGGWNVLITTYNLAQGDDHDRKFFRRIDWDVSLLALRSSPSSHDTKGLQRPLAQPHLKPYVHI